MFFIRLSYFHLRMIHLNLPRCGFNENILNSNFTKKAIAFLKKKTPESMSAY